MERSDLTEFLEEIEGLIEEYEDLDEIIPDDISEIEDELEEFRLTLSGEMERDEFEGYGLDFAEDAIDEISNIENAIKDDNFREFTKGLKKLYTLVKNALRTME